MTHRSHGITEPKGCLMKSFLGAGLWTSTGRCSPFLRARDVAGRTGGGGCSLCSTWIAGVPSTLSRSWLNCDPQTSVRRLLMSLTYFKKAAARCHPSADYTDYGLRLCNIREVNTPHIQRSLCLTPRTGRTLPRNLRNLCNLRIISASDLRLRLRLAG